jgi:hypothetical protein
MSFVPLMPVGYQDEVAVHEGVTLDAEPFRQELFLLQFVMNEHHIGVAAAPRVERLASSLSNDPHFTSRFRSAQRAHDSTALQFLALCLDAAISSSSSDGVRRRAWARG